MVLNANMVSKVTGAGQVEKNRWKSGSGLLGIRIESEINGGNRAGSDEYANVSFDTYEWIYDLARFHPTSSDGKLLFKHTRYIHH